MSNPHKGAIELKAGDRVLTLRFSVDAICAIEASTSKSLFDLVDEVANPKKVTISLARHLFYASLQEHHPDVHLVEAGDLMVEAGGVIPVMEKVTEAIVAAFPVAEAQDNPRPPRKRLRQRGTGAASS